MHYHVGHNIPGYLPESDPYSMRTLREAIKASRSDAQDHIDSTEDLCLTCFHSASVHFRTLNHCEHAECAHGGCKRYRAPRIRGSRGDYFVDDGRTFDTHYWVSDVCECAEGESEIDE